MNAITACRRRVEDDGEPSVPLGPARPNPTMLTGRGETEYGRAVSRAAAGLKLPFLLALATISQCALSPAAGADARQSVHVAVAAKLVSVLVPVPVPSGDVTIALHTVFTPGFRFSVSARRKHQSPGQYFVFGPTNGGTCQPATQHSLTCDYSFRVIGPGPYLIDFSRPLAGTAVTIAMTFKAGPTPTH
jgi:hypothetical protein